MNALALVPTPDPIPVAWGWFEGLGILTFGLHITLANVLVGGGLLALYLKLRDRNDPTASDVSTRLPTVFALTVNFGVAPLLFLQVLYGHFFYVSATLSAAWWLTIIAFLILGYYAMYINQHRVRAARPGGGIFLAAATGMTLCIGLILANVLTMMARPEAWTGYFDNPGGTMLNLLEPTLIPRYLHFVFASLAMGGLFAALPARFGKGTPEGLEKGMKVFTTATMLQMAAGVWWLVALERPVMLRFMGDSAFDTALFAIAVALTFPALAAGFRKKPVAAAAWIMAAIMAMSGVRAVVRSATLSPFFSPGDLAVTGEFSPLVLFLASLAVGLAALAYMLRLGFKTQEEG
ncbi:MAG: hypothetical protein H0S80_00050 [Desulfovibrionaceae bacterium]|nr:hypothetical protein [Desulfovibrionaceae bacterium]